MFGNLYNDTSIRGTDSDRSDDLSDYFYRMYVIIFYCFCQNNVKMKACAKVKEIFCLVTLDIYIYVSGTYSETKYSIAGICSNITYGIQVSKRNNAVSIVDCGVTCGEELTCLSFTFSDVTGTCITNQATYDTLGMPSCSSYIKYGEKLVGLVYPVKQ